MSYTNLADLFEAIADAIRAKKGTSALINPQDFPSEILSIPSGGGSTYYILQTITGDTCTLTITDAPSAGEEYNIIATISGDTQTLAITDV